MPLWSILHPPGTFEDSSTKEALATDITKWYTDLNLPAFYVVVDFVPTALLYVGGKPKTDTPFIRIIITHIAINMPNRDEVYRSATSRIDAILKPHIYDKGWASEYHVGETDRRLWKVNGMIPPAHGSEEEKLWARENKAVEYDGAFVA